MNEGSFYRLEGPLDSSPVERQMRTANLNGFARLVRERGGDPQAVLAQYGIDPRLAHEPDAFIDSKAWVDTLEFCSQTLHDPLFGLHLAELQAPDIYGSVNTLCRAAATVREAIRCFVEYIPVIHSPVPLIELLEGPEVAEVRWWVPDELGQNTQASLQAALLNLKLLRQIGGAGLELRYVHLTVGVSRQAIPEIEKILGCPFSASASHNVIAFPAFYLDEPVRTANRMLFRLLSGYLQSVKAASRSTTVERVEDYVRGALSLGNCTIERCAKKLGVSVRTLQINLGEQGLRFSDMVESLRMEMAIAHLEEKLLPLEAIAAGLGYADQSSFGRAFKRWTGRSPQQFRREASPVLHPSTRPFDLKHPSRSETAVGHQD